MIFLFAKISSPIKNNRNLDGSKLNTIGINNKMSTAMINNFKCFFTNEINDKKGLLFANKKLGNGEINDTIPLVNLSIIPNAAICG